MHFSRLPFISVLLGLAAVCIHLFPAATSALQFDREAVLTGETYRLITCHWTHFSLDHLLWDVLTFVVLGALCERASRLRLLGCLVGSVGAISIAVLALRPELETYRGLSGLDSAFFSLLAVTILRQKLSDRDWLWVGIVGLVFVGFLGKTAFELYTGLTLFVDSHASGMVPVPLAHVAGAAVGCLSALGTPAPLESLQPAR